MFEGCYTALVTPFNRDGGVDYGKLEALIDRQAEHGVDGVVPVGTTGESPSLNVDEHGRVIDVAIHASKGRMKVIAGTGANATYEALELTRRAMAAGADGTLQVTPYYNKPNQEGLYRHFSAVADLGLPVVLYNVPGRTSLEIAVETVVKLAEHPHVAAVKEAAGSCDRVSAIRSACDIEIMSGDDALTFPMMALGATGVISVASNVAPRLMSDMVHAALKGEWARARDLHYRGYALFRDLFIDTSPIPCKAAMAMMGQIEDVCRLPLCALADEPRAQLRRTLDQLGLV